MALRIFKRLDKAFYNDKWQLMGMDKHSRLISKAVEDGRWRPIMAGRQGLTISHLMFADDLCYLGKQ
ncbi:hypothetical protein JHK87_001777 [Glycine soja]|nr:hypothetical protein JHK87_001777 [Glycine soja]